MTQNRIPEDIYVCGLTTEDGESFSFEYTLPYRLRLLKHFGDLARDDDINFSWNDAAVMCKAVREQYEERDESNH